MTRIAVATIMTFLFLIQPSRAACDEATRFPRMAIIALSSGDEYDVSPGHQATAALWTEGDKRVGVKPR